MVEEFKSKEQQSIEGLGGWLIIVGAGLLVTPFRILIETIVYNSEIFKGNTWQILTTPGSLGYHPFWAPLIIGEMILNLGMALAAFYLIYLFFCKKKIFPKLYIGYIIFAFLFIVIDAALIRIVTPNNLALSQEVIKEATRSIISLAIWVPYMLLSKRVKATFVF